MTATSTAEARRTHWVGYTTLYREGGPKFRRAAETKARDLARTGARVVCEAVESKRDFVEAMRRIADRKERIAELHFIGHSGMYGPMFRTTEMPEQLSPHEWRTLSIPFAEGASAFWHSCRSARFFAPFFARTFGVTSHGFHLYTSVSLRPDRFVVEAPWTDPRAPLWIVAIAGRKSHGVLGSIAKYSHVWPTEPMKRFEPSIVDPSYDPVAELYDEAFSDISVRKAEIAFIEARLPPSRPRVLELGTGNGALLAHLAPRISAGVGVDRSASMIDHGRRRCAKHPHIELHAVDTPALPVADASVDVVVSLLSWRYLDWDPIMAEIRRVLAPGGRLLVVDMVELPATLGEAPRVLADKARQWAGHARNRRFRRDLRTLVTDPRWAAMLRENPIRAEHEYRWYFESRFPGRRIETLTVAPRTRVVAFDTGPLERGFTLPQSYP